MSIVHIEVRHDWLLDRANDELSLGAVSFLQAKDTTTEVAVICI
jgi:hypothetical protein